MLEANVRKEMFAFRNGIVADTLRRAGMPYEVIFGLNLPQLGQIARSVKDDPAVSAKEAHRLALSLWSDTKCREARLLACHLFSADILDAPELEKIITSLQTREEADIMTLRTLRFIEDESLRKAADNMLTISGFPPRS